MQHLLDFIQEHTLEDQLYLVVQCPAGELELIWRRSETPQHWQLRPYRCEGPWELVPRAALIETLDERSADMVGVKRELHAILAAQIAFADMVLRDADRQLGVELVQRFVLGHRDFIAELEAVVDQLVIHPRPSMVVVDGGGAQTTLRAGHLSLVR